jgi:hypothetical protein
VRVVLAARWQVAPEAENAPVDSARLWRGIRPNFAIRLPGSCGHLSAYLPALDCPHRSFAIALRAYESVNESAQRRGRRFMVSPVSGAPACPQVLRNSALARS